MEILKTNSKLHWIFVVILLSTFFSGQQALQLENVGEKMANLIYGLLKIEYKDYVKNPFQEYEDALETDLDDLDSRKSSKRSATGSNGSSLFSKPGNSFSSKLLQKEMNFSKEAEEEDEANDFKDVKKKIAGIDIKRKISKEEENSTGDYHRVAPRLALEEGNERKIEKED